MKTKDEVIASLTVNGFADMTKRQKDKITSWLHRQADYLEEHGGELSKKFRARYIK